MDVEFSPRQGRSQPVLASLLTLLLSVAFLTPIAVRAGESTEPPSAVEVLPVFFVPQGQAAPSAKERKLVLDHLSWTQRTYSKLLKGRSNFRVAAREPLVLEARHTLDVYRQLPEMAAPAIVGEIFDHLHENRFSNPYVFLVIVANRQDEFPVGGGRPINGGVNEGGGIVVLSQFAFNSTPNIQSTLRHEIGHGFGLMHVNAYRYDMTDNASIMSYNPNHHTQQFQDSKTPGVLIPEDLRVLALNDRGFDKLSFSVKNDVPVGYSLCRYLPSLPAMQIAGHPDYTIQLSSKSPNEYDSDLNNIVQKQVLPNTSLQISYNPKTMWHTSPDGSGWVLVKIKFPRPVSLDKILLHSEHSGQYHRVGAARIAVLLEGKLHELADENVNAADFELTFPRTESREWSLSMRPGPSGLVCIRGLQFFDGEQEWFRPTVVLP